MLLTTRVDVMALEARATAADPARATGLLRFPVYRDTMDEVIGAVHIRGVLTLQPDTRAGPVHRTGHRAPAGPGQSDRRPAP